MGCKSNIIAVLLEDIEAFAGQIGKGAQQMKGVALIEGKGRKREEDIIRV